MSESEKYSHKIIKKIRIRIPDSPGALGLLGTEFGKKGAMLGDITRISVSAKSIVRDMIVYFNSEEHVRSTLQDVGKLKGYQVLSVEDIILNLHKGGKIAVNSLVSIDTIDQLRMVYTPGVAQVCRFIQKEPDSARTYTSIGRTVCIATNGSAVLGLGDIGVLAGMPVMEGKSVIVNKMAGVSCIPILIESSDAGRIVDILEGISRTFSLIMIEDIKAPLCFEVEDELQKRIPIPVFHDDQHGTATVILAAFIRALKLTGKKKEEVRIAVNGAGASGMATCRMLLRYGIRHIVMCDREGAIYRGRKQGMNSYKDEIASVTNRNAEKGQLKDIIKGKDIFIGLSAPGMVSREMIRSMNKKPIVFSLANPVPEIWPAEALEAGAAIALDGRIINNALAFPGIIRGTLDALAAKITFAMKISAAEKLASLCRGKEVVPDFMDLSLHRKVARAVQDAAGKKE